MSPHPPWFFFRAVPPTIPHPQEIWNSDPTPELKIVDCDTHLGPAYGAGDLSQVSTFGTKAAVIIYMVVIVNGDFAHTHTHTHHAIEGREFILLCLTLNTLLGAQHSFICR